MRFLYLLLGACWALSGQLTAQATFFLDSSDPRYYDTGLAFPTAPSSLAQAGPSGDKFPVEADLPAYQGENSLRLSWTSRPGGDWAALVIAPGWGFQNITTSDILSFWVYSAEGLDRRLLPKVYMEGAPGTTKSRSYPLADFSADIPAGQWTEIRVPLSTFFDDPNDQTGIQFNQIKAIIFGQDSADNQAHTLLIDAVRTFNTASANDPMASPVNFQAQGYDSHVELSWAPNLEPYLSGYRLYVSRDGGQTFFLRKFLSPLDTSYQDFVREWGLQQDLQYRLTAVNFGDGESAPAGPVGATVRPFSDEELIDMVQAYTFRYFWNFAHPTSGLARERNTSLQTVTSGGSGFGIMALLVGMERGYISRAQGIARLQKITDFLAQADRFYGAWPHWMNGSTGNTIPFSAFDDGGDLVETAFLVQGLLAARTYFDGTDSVETALRARLTTLWEGVNWNWYRKLTQQVLFWHWSPNFGWQMNFPLRGFNEVHITYLLALASPTHPVPASLYANGWAGGSPFLNGNSYYGWPLRLGSPYGGPLFFAHYSYLGFDPRYKRDAYANYFERNYHHTLINRQWCIENPLGHAGYSATSWGLTASDDPLVGYLAHEPGSSDRDNGTIAPTAALGSMPYTPEASLAALKHFYRERGHRLWGPMGFYDAYNDNEAWYARSYLAIDQGPIIVMLENYRSGLLWDLFMANPEIDDALTAAGFVPDTTRVGLEAAALPLPLTVYPQPAQAQVWVQWEQPQAGPFRLDLYDGQGRAVGRSRQGQAPAGPQESALSLDQLAPGLYFLRLEAAGQRAWHKVLRTP